MTVEQAALRICTLFNNEFAMRSFTLDDDCADHHIQPTSTQKVASLFDYHDGQVAYMLYDAVSEECIEVIIPCVGPHIWGPATDIFNIEGSHISFDSFKAAKLFISKYDKWPKSVYVRNSDGRVFYREVDDCVYIEDITRTQQREIKHYEYVTV